MKTDAKNVAWRLDALLDHVRLIFPLPVFLTLLSLSLSEKMFCFFPYSKLNVIVSFRSYFHKTIFIHHYMTEYRMISLTAIQDKCQFCSHKRQLLNIEPRQKT